MFTTYPKAYHNNVGQKALDTISGLGFSLLTNTDSNTFWYTSDDFETRYRQEDAKVGDTFYDGNNGDRHVVVAVDLESSRLVYRNETNLNPECLEIAAW